MTSYREQPGIEVKGHNRVLQFTLPLFLFCTLHLVCCVRNAAAAIPFSDVSLSEPGYLPIRLLQEIETTVGCSQTEFCPRTTVTRELLAVILAHALYGQQFESGPPATGTIFKDVPANSLAAPYIERLFTNGLLTGCKNNMFCPKAVLTRDQLAVALLLMKYGAGYLPPAALGKTFLDVPADHTAAAWIEQLAYDGITDGCADGFFCPSKLVTRSELSILLVNAMGLRRIDLVPIETVDPLYPARAVTRGVEGECLVEFIVSLSGSVIAPKIVYCSPESLFERSSINAILDFKYEEQTVEVISNKLFTYRLE